MITEDWPSPEPSRPSFLTWLHLPACNPLDVTVLSNRPLTYTAHWTGGRLTPCIKPCPACDRGIPPKRRLILYVLDNDLQSTHLLELPARLGPDIQRAISHTETQSLRGLRMILEKAGRTPHGTIEIRETYSTQTDGLPMPPPDLASLVRAMLSHNP